MVFGEAVMIVFAVCVDNHDYPVSLGIGGIYQIISDADAEKHHQIRVIDERARIIFILSGHSIKWPCQLPLRLFPSLSLLTFGPWVKPLTACNK
jgi:hypothetical protein